MLILSVYVTMFVWNFVEIPRHLEEISQTDLLQQPWTQLRVIHVTYFHTLIVLFLNKW